MWKSSFQQRSVLLLRSFDGQLFHVQPCQVEKDLRSSFARSARRFAAHPLGRMVSFSISGLEVSLKANQSLYYSSTETAAISVFIHDVSVFESLNTFPLSLLSFQKSEDIFIETPRYASAPGGVDQIVISQVSGGQGRERSASGVFRRRGSVSAGCTATASPPSRTCRRTTTEATTQST